MPEPGSSRGGRPAVTAGPSVIDPRIAAELRRFRDDQGLPGETVARALRWSPSKISRMERAVSPVSRRSLDRILVYYTSQGMDLGRANAIRRMLEQAMDMYRYQHPLLGPAVMAQAVLEWAPLEIPRLLQVPEYATAVLASTGQYSPAEVREAVAAILRWQELLRGDHPVRLCALLDESVLYRVAGSADVMKMQLAFLDDLIANGSPGNTRIMVRVLPLAAAGLPRHVPGFSYLEYAQVSSVEPAAEIMTSEFEGPGQPGLAEKPVWRRLQLFDQLWAAADEPGPAVRRALDVAWGADWTPRPGQPPVSQKVQFPSWSAPVPA